MMPGRYASYPAYSGGQQYPPQLFPYQQYAPAYGWGYPPYAQYPGVPVGNQYPGYPAVSPRQRRQRRRSMSPAEELQVHEFLGGRHRPIITWQVSEDITTIQRIQGRGVLERIPPALLSKPATEPPVHHMHIICDDTTVSIDIEPRNEFVTVQHVLGAIYGVLQEPIDLESWQAESVNGKKHLHRARCARLARSAASFKVDAHIKKVDLLGDKTFFMGLKPIGPPDHPVEWLLKLAPPPKPARR